MFLEVFFTALLDQESLVGVIKTDKTSKTIRNNFKIGFENPFMLKS